MTKQQFSLWLQSQPYTTCEDLAFKAYQKARAEMIAFLEANDKKSVKVILEEVKSIINVTKR